MPLESLLKLADTLKERACVHRETLSASETLTRYALIDPLLRELGWDTADPAAVIPEYTSPSGRADYALMSAGKPAIMVEAKKLGTPLRDNVLTQVLNYCTSEGTEYCAVTDGARWDIYKTFIPNTEPDQRRIVAIDLSADSPASVCLKALALWRPSVEAGLVEPAQTPAIGIDNSDDGATQPMNGNPPLPDGDWRRFSDTGYAKGQKPTELLFPDNTRTALKGWFSLLVETTRWLSSNGHLTKAHCPIMPKRAGVKRYIVHAKPVHSDGKDFMEPSEVNGLHVDKNNQVKVHFKRAVTVIEHVGQDPSQFRVRFA